MNEYYIKTIYLMKRQLSSQPVSKDDVSALALAVGIEIDRCKVNNQPSSKLESLYNDIIWLKCNL